MPNDRRQTVKESADHLKVAGATVRRWIGRGDPRAIDIGKGWRIADADLAALLKRRETTPPPPASPGSKDARWRT